MPNFYGEKERMWGPQLLIHYLFAKFCDRQRTPNTGQCHIWGLMLPTAQKLYLRIKRGSYVQTNIFVIKVLKSTDKITLKFEYLLLIQGGRNLEK